MKKIKIRIDLSDPWVRKNLLGGLDPKDVNKLSKPISLRAFVQVFIDAAWDLQAFTHFIKTWKRKGMPEGIALGLIGIAIDLEDEWST